MVPSNTPSHDKREHRWLRVTTVLAFLPTFALHLPYGIISARPLPTVGIAAMFFSAAFSTLVLGGRIRAPGVRACGDLLLAASIIAILIPSWTFFSQDHESWWNERERLIILATYGTTPVILNFTLHTFAAFHTIYTKLRISWKTDCCPNCHPHILHVSQSAADLEGGDKDTVRTNSRFYDDDERKSSEFQTSGFNTPRLSEETLATSTRTSGDLL